MEQQGLINEMDAVLTDSVGGQLRTGLLVPNRASLGRRMTI